MIKKRIRISGLKFRVFIIGALILAVACLSAGVKSMAAEIVGCDTSVDGADYSAGFDAGDFDFTNVGVDGNGDLILQTGNQAINPNAVKIPFTQDVKVTFLFEGAGHKSDFGWMLYEDAVNADGTFKGWNNIELAKKHPVFVNIDSDGSGRLKNSLTATDVLPLNNDEQLATWNDGTGLPFIVEEDDDLNVTYKDMTKSLGDVCRWPGIGIFSYR